MLWLCFSTVVLLAEVADVFLTVVELDDACLLASCCSMALVVDEASSPITIEDECTSLLPPPDLKLTF